MKIKPPKPSFERILSFIPLFEPPDYKCGKWHKKADFFNHCSDVMCFIATLYEDNWVYDFDWGKWHSEALAFYEEPGRLALASVEQLQKLLTFHVRKDRFVEGHLAAMFHKGHILGILRRISEIYNQDPTKTKPRYSEQTMTFPEPLLAQWRNRNYSMIENSEASEFIKKILVQKAKRRPGQRFFGEAYVASKSMMKKGWYGSFKWLTSWKWITGEGLKPEFEKPFHDALIEHFGAEALKNLQRKAAPKPKIKGRMLLEGIRTLSPVPPDLWIVDSDGRHKFIECKLPGDKIRPNQVLGLTLLQDFLLPSQKGEASLVSLYPSIVR